LTLYHYTAIGQNGAKIEGEMEALGRKTVFDQLHDQGHLPVDVTEAGNRGQQIAGQGSFFSRAPSAAQITLFTRELAMLLKAGQSLDQALGLLASDTGSAKLNKLIGQVRAKINEGRSFHEALEAQGRAFEQVYISMVQVAEASGTLDTVLERIADARERDQKLRSKALSAMLYPALLVATAIGAVIVMLIFVVPKFKDMLVNTGAQSADTSLIAITASDWLIENGMTFLVVLLVALIALTLLLRQRGFRQNFDGILLKLPLAGHLLRLNLTIHFCRTLGTLLENGVDLPAALSLTQNVMGNKVAAKVIGDAQEALRKGQNFTKPLIAANLFPPVVVNLLKVGEETGGLSASTLYLARMFEDKLELAIQRLFTILEPAIIILVSLFVAGIIISIIGAVISVNDLAL